MGTLQPNSKLFGSPSTAASRLAVVTGASSGIGRELAKQFAMHGFDLLITAEDESLLGAKQELEAVPGVGKVQAIRVDLRHPEEIEVLYEAIRSVGVTLYAIALNAGVGVGGEFARETELQRELEIIDLNIKSVVHLAKRVLPEMIERGEGRVLFTSSIVATMPGPLNSVYAASKAFVQSFADAIREELKDTGVTITTLQPGATETNFFHRANMDDTNVGQAKKDDPADVARQGFEALMAGRDHIVAGSLKNSLMAAANKVLPETTKARMHAKQNAPADPKS